MVIMSCFLVGLLVILLLKLVFLSFLPVNINVGPYVPNFFFHWFCCVISHYICIFMYQLCFFFFFFLIATLLVVNY